MARQPKPWFRENRQAWFVTIGGCRHNLGPNKKAAFDRFYALMRQLKESKQVASTAFAATADAFLDWVKTNRAEDTYKWYRYRLEQFSWERLQLDDTRLPLPWYNPVLLRGNT